MDKELQYGRLSQALVSPAGCYLLEAFNPPHVTLDSPAINAMTNLAQMPAATIGADASLDTANQSMIARGVRLLLVVGENRKITGMVTSVDILGEKSVQVAQARQLRPSELRVADIMVPVDRMEALSMDDVHKASVGNIVATLKADGRAHALVLGHGTDGRQVLQGIFSASQIARQLGKPIQTYEVARTFAEIEAVIASV